MNKQRLPHFSFQKWMIIYPILFLSTFVFSTSSKAQTSLLQSGPMVGHVDIEDVVLWVQTKKPASVQFRYWQKNNPSVVLRSEVIKTEKNNAFIAKAFLGGLQGGTEYGYDVYINKKKVIRKYTTGFKTQPMIHVYQKELPNFTFATGSCFYTHDEKSDRPGSTEYGDGVKIMESVAKENVDLMLWMGDNTYYNRPHATTKAGMQRRMTQSRSTPELQPLLGSVPQYAIWDDHDYGPNDSDRSFELKREALQVFQDFWSNPNFALGKNKGIVGKLKWYDVEFYFLDNRWFRSPNRLYSGKREYLGDEQIQWLKESLASSFASFKFIVVGGQVVNKAMLWENYAQYPEDRLKLYQAIRDSKARGVIFMDGDRHHTILRKMKLPGLYPLYDFTCSPLTAGAHGPKKMELDADVIEGTLVEQKNYGLLKISGPPRKRILEIEVKDASGTSLWTQIIKQEELK